VRSSASLEPPSPVGPTSWTSPTSRSPRKSGRLRKPASTRGPPVVLADASAFIAFTQIEQLSLLQKLFAEILVPPAVAREAAPSLPQLPAWIRIRTPEGPLHAALAKVSLVPGETEAISLALKAKADRIILDDRQARNLAPALGLAIVGRAGVLRSVPRPTAPGRRP
jgi:predicted nucleic acid-binding protein